MRNDTMISKGRDRMRQVGRVLAVAGAAFFATSLAHAETWPTRPVKIVATYQPGGTNDIMARLAAQVWTEALGVPVSVENRPGANGNLGTELVAHTKGDGYTLLAGTFGPITIAPTLDPDLAYDPLRDFVPVVLISSVPNVIVVHPSSPATTFAQFVELARKSPTPLRVGLVAGGTPHFLLENLKRATGIKLQYVPYKGGASALNDLVGNHIDLYIDNIPLVLPQIRGGKARALAVAADKRSPVLAEIATTRELGYPDVVITAWHGILAPKGTPPEVVKKLNETLVAALRTPAVAERVTSQGAVVVASTPQEFAAFIRSEIPYWANVIRTSGLGSELK